MVQKSSSKKKNDITIFFSPEEGGLGGPHRGSGVTTSFSFLKERKTWLTFLDAC